MNLRTGALASMLFTTAGCQFLGLTTKNPNLSYHGPCAAETSSANEPYTPCNYIRGNAHKSLVIEIDSVEYVDPINKQDIELLEKILSKIIDKPKGIKHIMSSTDIPLKKEQYSIADIYDIIEENRSIKKEQLSLYVLYLNGSYVNDSTAGLSLNDGVIVVFRDHVKKNYDKAILMHEIGHQLGLVNGGIEQQRIHEDKNHQWHDANNVCVMYYRLTNHLNYLFDKQCLEDIKAVRDD